MTGVRWKTSTFDLEVGVGRDRDYFSGEVATNLRKEVRDRSLFDQEVRVVLERRIVRSPLERGEVTRYKLVEIHAVGHVDDTPSR